MRFARDKLLKKGDGVICISQPIGEIVPSYLEKRMMKKLIWILPVFLMTGWSCDKSTVDCCAMPGAFSDFIFGTYYGECLGEGCIETFRLRDEKLYEDENDNYGGPFPYPGEWEQLSDEKYQSVKDLPTSLPDQLFTETETTIGMPDAGDWGGIYIEVEDLEGNRHYWNIDTMKDNLPQYLHDFTDAVQAAVAAINE